MLYLCTGIADKSKHDGIAYTTLTYATGQKTNYQYNRRDNGVSRDDPSLKDTTDINYAQQAAILTDKETHGGGDVTVYAMGKKCFLICINYRLLDVSFPLSNIFFLNIRLIICKFVIFA